MAAENKKLFIVRFTFRCGEAELPFEHTVLAGSKDDLERRVTDYLRSFAAEAGPVGDFSYQYYAGYYAVSYCGCERATPESVVRNMLMP